MLAVCACDIAIYVRSLCAVAIINFYGDTKMFRYMIRFLMILILLGTPILASTKSIPIYPEQIYVDAKAALVKQGWKPVINLKIQESSLYAQDVYNLGILEVVDCISMERDSCLFRFSKNKKVSEVKTFGKDLKVDSYEMINSSIN